MTFLVSVMLGVWAAATLLNLGSSLLTLKQFSRTPPHLDAPFGLIPVTILKPLKGRDEGLRRNLVSFFELDYPEYELIFSIANAQDPARWVAEELMARYPGVPARLVIGDVEAGFNPKVNNLVRSYALACHDWILISDSNVRANPGYLKRLVAHLDPGVGMITSIVAGRQPMGMGARLEATYLNTFYAKGMTLAAAAGHPCVMGKSMLFQKSTAERFGGIKVLGRYLAEDYMAGEAMKKLGLRTVLASDPVDQYLGRYSLSDFWSRHVRWGRIRKAQAPITFLAEPWLGSFVSGILGSFAFSLFFGGFFLWPLLIHLALWCSLDLAIMRKMRAKVSPLAAGSWLLRETLAFPLWVHIALGRTVTWRGSRFVVQPGGLLHAET